LPVGVLGIAVTPSHGLCNTVHYFIMSFVKLVMKNPLIFGRILQHQSVQASTKHPWRNKENSMIQPRIQRNQNMEENKRGRTQHLH